MPNTHNGWITREELVDSLGIQPHADQDLQWADVVVRAVNRFIRDLRPDLPYPSRFKEYGPFSRKFSNKFDNSTGNLGGVNPRIQMGALLLGQSWYARRGTGTDVAAYAEFGAVPPPTISRDIEVILEINRGFRGAFA